MSHRSIRLLARTCLAAMIALPVAFAAEADAQPGRRGGGGGGGDEVQRGQDGAQGRGRGGRQNGQGQPGGRGGNQNGRGGGFGGFGGGGGGGGMWTSFMRPGWERRDLRVLDDGLDLDRDQEMIVETLLADYLEGFEAASEAQQEAMRATRPDMQMDEETRAEFNTVRQEVRDIRERMRGLEQAGEAGDEAASALREELSSQMRTRIEAIREKAAAFRPSAEEREESSLAMASLIEQWLRERALLDAAFREEVSVILTERQLELLPVVEQTVRRARKLPTGRLSGESVDVAEIAREAEVEPLVDPMLADLWVRYHANLDRLLVSRDAHIERAAVVWMDAFRTREFEAVLESSQTEASLRGAIRDLNLQTAREAMFVLGEAGVDETAIAAWRDAWREKAFRQAWAPTVTQRAMVMAASFEDVAPDTAAAIEQLMIAYLTEIDGINTRMEAEIIESDANRIVGRIQRFVDRMQGAQDGQGGGRGRDRGTRGEQEQTPLQALTERRREIGAEYRLALEALLTPEQIEALPAERRRGGAGGDVQQQMLERFDRNGDGELDEAERNAARESWRGGGRGGDGENAGGGRGGRGGNANGGGGRGGRGGRGGGGGGGGNAAA